METTISSRDINCDNLSLVRLVFRVGLSSCINKVSVMFAVVISFSGRENFKMMPFSIMPRGFDEPRIRTQPGACK